jgi:hypothetical protein
LEASAISKHVSTRSLGNHRLLGFEVIVARLKRIDMADRKQPTGRPGRSGSWTIPRPPFDSLVVALETQPEVVYAVAEVVHSRPIVVQPSGEVKNVDEGSLGVRGSRVDGIPMFLVGTRFTGRLRPEEAAH